MATEATPKVVSPNKLAHVVLRTKQIDKMVDWYLDFLGARIAHRNPQLAFITYDDEHHRLAFVNLPHIQDKVRQSAGLEHIAFTFASLRDLLTAYQQRLALPEPVKPVWCINHRTTTSMYYKDPDGNLLETQIDNFGDDVVMANKIMESDSMANNPFGFDFDPDELLRQVEAEGEEATLRKLQNPVDDGAPRGMETVPEAYMN